jgi:serine/threonine protein kinase
MKALDKNSRPECKQILEKKYFWYLNPFDSSLKGFIDESLTLSSTKKSFSQHFIQQKFKYYSNNFEESYNQEMKNNKYKQEFEEIGLISTGSYGIVCKAKNRESCEFFAVKKIPFNEELRDLVMKEIESLPNLKSTLVVKLESVWIEDNYLKIDDYNTDKYMESIGKPEIFKHNKSLLLHIQMELCLMTLRDVINKLNNELNQYRSEVMTPLGYYISSQLFEEIVESVDYLHKQNPSIIHRDLKPNNILITDGTNGRFVKIADFGLATFHEFAGQSHTKYNETIKYAAREVIDSSEYDTKADIYSLGVILQELFNIYINKYLKYKSFFNFIISYLLLNFRSIGEGSKLEDKYLNLFELAEQMTSSLKKRRPNCDELLLKKNLWSLNLTELQNDSEFKSKKMQFSDIFHSYFIKMKSKMSLNLSDIEINDY